MGSLDSESAVNGKRRGDFRFTFGPFGFEGHGVNFLVGVLSIATVLMAGALFYLVLEARETSINIRGMSEGQKLLACIVSKAEGERETQLENPNSRCRRFARGEPI